MFLLVGSGPRKLITVPPFMIFLGKISYGLYLYHLMVFFGYDWIAKQLDFSSRFNLSLWEQVWLRMLIVGTVAIGIAYLSRRYFEEPFLRLKDRLPGRSAKATERHGEKATATF